MHEFSQIAQDQPIAHALLMLATVAVVGLALGALKYRGIGLGTAGVLFAALVFGHFGMSVPKEVMDFGLILFVYAVGLTAGPSFFRTFRRRGMQFVVKSQLPPPQAGWALQYGKDMKPAKARNNEPAAVTPGQTIDCIRSLEAFYKITGDRDFLRGIPDAVRWLESSVLNGGRGAVYEGKTYTHATFYEPGTNKPIYPHRKKSRAELQCLPHPVPLSSRSGSAGL